MCLSSFQQSLLPARLLWEWVCVLYEAGKFAWTCIYFLIFSFLTFLFCFVLFCVVLLSCSLSVCLSLMYLFLFLIPLLFFTFPCFSLFVIHIFLQYFFFVCRILYFFHFLCGIWVDQSDADALFFFPLTQRDTVGINISEDNAAIIPFPWSQSQTPPAPIWLSYLLKGAKYVAFHYEIFLILLSLPPFWGHQMLSSSRSGTLWVYFSLSERPSN